jgi:hypothetical protein
MHDSWNTATRTARSRRASGQLQRPIGSKRVELGIETDHNRVAWSIAHRAIGVPQNIRFEANFLKHCTMP